MQLRPGIKVPGLVMYLLFNNLDPSFRRFDFTHLDAGQRVVNLLGGRTHLLHSAWEADLFTVIYNLSDRRDYGCRSAEAALGKVFNFIQEHFPLLSLHTQIFTGNVEDRAACDGWENAGGFWCDQFIVFCDKDQVGAACFLKFSF